MHRTILDPPRLAIRQSDAHAARSRNRLPQASNAVDYPASPILQQTLPSFDSLFSDLRIVSKNSQCSLTNSPASRQKLPPFDSLFSDLERICTDRQHPSGHTVDGRYFPSDGKDYLLPAVLTAGNVLPYSGPKIIQSQLRVNDSHGTVSMASGIPQDDSQSHDRYTDLPEIGTTSPLTHEGSFPATLASIPSESFRLEYARTVEHRVAQAAYAVQVLDDHRRAPSKAWVISITFTRGTKEGPRLRVCIHHDAQDPYRLQTHPPPRITWLRVQLITSPAVVRHGGELAQLLEEQSKAYTTEVLSWGLNAWDKMVLDSALNQIGNGFPASRSVPLQQQPWIDFKNSCGVWDGSLECARRRNTVAERSRDYRRRKFGSLGSYET